MSDVAGDVFHDFGGGRFCPRFENHERLRHLPGLLVGNRYDRGVGHRRMGEQEPFELGGGHLESLVLDELLEPVDDVPSM